MLTILRDPVWQFAGFIVSLLSLLTAIFVDRHRIFAKRPSKSRRRNTKKISPKSAFLLGVSLASISLSLAGLILNSGTKQLDEPNLTPIIVEQTSISTIPDQFTPIPSPSSVKSADLLFEDFSKPTISWDTGEKKGEWGYVSRSIQNGKYTWEVVSINGVFTSHVVNISEVDKLQMKADFHQISQPGEVSYGLIFHVSEKGFYFFKIRDQGKFQLTLRDEVHNQWSIIVDWINTTAINPSTTNTLKVVTESSDMQLFINDQLVSKVSDTTLTKGKVGFAVSVDKEQSTILEIDNFQMSIE